MRAHASHPKPPRTRGLNETWAGNILPFPRKSPDFFPPPLLPPPNSNLPPSIRSSLTLCPSSFIVPSSRIFIPLSVFPIHLSHSRRFGFDPLPRYFLPLSWECQIIYRVLRMYTNFLWSQLIFLLPRGYLAKSRYSVLEISFFYFSSSSERKEKVRRGFISLIWLSLIVSPKFGRCRNFQLFQKIWKTIRPYKFVLGQN